MQMIYHPAAAWICILLGLALYTAALAHTLRKKPVRTQRLAPALLMPAGAGLLCAKAGYELLQYGELASVFRWCLTTGMAGLLLGTFLAARLAGQKGSRVLDRTAPALCVTMALVRLSQRWLGEVGAGPWMEEGMLLHRFPFVLVNEWEETLLAAFVPEAMAALLAALIAFLHERKRGEKGEKTGTAGGTAVLAVLFLTIPQMLLEQFRTGHYMHWRMVRAEQVLCVLAALAAVLLFRLAGCRKDGKDTGDLFPATAFFLLMCAVIAFVQFVLDGKLMELPETVCWVLYGMATAGMLLACCGMTLKGEKPAEEDSSAEKGDVRRCKTNDSD